LEKSWKTVSRDFLPFSHKGISDVGQEGVIDNVSAVGRVSCDDSVLASWTSTCASGHCHRKKKLEAHIYPERYIV